MKKLLLIIAAIASLGCSSLSNKKPNPLPDEIVEWYGKKPYNGHMGNATLELLRIPNYENYNWPHLWMDYDLDGDGIKDLEAAWKIGLKPEEGRISKYPTLLNYDSDRDGNPDTKWYDLDNDGTIEFEEKIVDYKLGD